MCVCRDFWLYAKVGCYELAVWESVKVCIDRRREVLR